MHLTHGSELNLNSQCALRLCDVAEAAETLRKSDIFAQSLSDFDRSARLKVERKVTQQEFLQFVSEQARPFETNEVAKLNGIVESMVKKLAPFHLNLPKTILLLKTTGREEGQAAYCRSNTIVLPQAYVDKPGSKLEPILIHELFHILTQNNPKLRDSLYEIIGFKSLSGLQFPSELVHRKITNPDAPVINHCMEVFFENKPLRIVPILFSKVERFDPAQGKEFFGFMEFKLMVVERGDKAWRPKLRDGKTWLLNPGDVPDFQEKIGSNTGYIIHPEEILAENFVLLVTGGKEAPTPRILNEMKRHLQQPQKQP